MVLPCQVISHAICAATGAGSLLHGAGGAAATTACRSELRRERRKSEAGPASHLSHAAFPRRHDAPGYAPSSTQRAREGRDAGHTHTAAHPPVAIRVSEVHALGTREEHPLTRGVSPLPAGSSTGRNAALLGFKLQSLEALSHLGFSKSGFLYSCWGRVTDFKQARLRSEYLRRHRDKKKKKKNSTHLNQRNLRAGTAQKLLSQN